MNRSSSGFQFSKAFVGFEQYKAAEGLSPNTLINYKQHLRLFLEFGGDVDINKVTTQDVRAFLAWLRTDYKPKRFSGDDRPLSRKTVRNVWATLSSFFRWAGLEFNLANPMIGIPAPRFETAPVKPFSKESVEKLLKACKMCRESRPFDRRRFTTKRPMYRRDQALILTLLDTGLRASELCSLRIEDFDIKTGRVDVRHGVTGGAKGGKGRVVYLGRTARRSLWRYLAEREDDEDPEAPLFLGKFYRPLNKDALRQLVKGLGKKAGVKNCHPHRFRHTFAITYLRSGGDVFTLQALLGHSSLKMVQHYARIAEIDLQRAHRKASPADNWRL